MMKSWLAAMYGVDEQNRLSPFVTNAFKTPSHLKLLIEEHFCAPEKDKCNSPSNNQESVDDSMVVEMDDDVESTAAGATANIIYIITNFIKETSASDGDSIGENEEADAPAEALSQGE
eukprot:1582599-Ditylum_brightwellii.AAC.1